MRSTSQGREAPSKLEETSVRIPTIRGSNLSESQALKNNTLDAPTKNALVAFQKRHSLPQHGKLDRATLLKLVPELKDTKRYTVKE